jgi:isopenicillin N synthase-like dioxygenase
VKQSIAAEVGRGVSDIGFLVITGHGVDPGLIAQVQAHRRRFLTCRWRKSSRWLVRRRT